MEWEQTCHRRPIMQLKLCGFLLNTFAPTSGVIVCLGWLRTCSPSQIQLLEEEWEERPDWASYGLSNPPMCVCLCVCSVPQSKLLLICIVWVNTAMNYSLWIKAQEPLSSFPLLLLFFKCPSCWIHSEYKTFCRKSPNHFFLFQLAQWLVVILVCCISVSPSDSCCLM